MRRTMASWLLVGLLFMVSGCITPQAGVPVASESTILTVFAAASLTDAFGEIGQNFTAANPGVDFVFNFAGSNQLATQLGEGAPADVFASANARQMVVAIEAGRIVTGTPRTFTRNRLVAVTPTDNPAGITTLEGLATPGVKIVFAVKEVPVGQYSLDFLDKAAADGSLGAGYKEAVLANVVSEEENVRAVLTKVTVGEADAGIVYNSDITREAAEAVQRIEIPDALNTIAAYPIATVEDSANAELAQKFVDYVLSPAAQAVLVKYGFLAVK